MTLVSLLNPFDRDSRGARDAAPVKLVRRLDGSRHVTTYLPAFVQVVRQRAHAKQHHVVHPHGCLCGELYHGALPFVFEHPPFQKSSENED